MAMMSERVGFSGAGANLQLDRKLCAFMVHRRVIQFALSFLWQMELVKLFLLWLLFCGKQTSVLHQHTDTLRDYEYVQLLLLTIALFLLMTTLVNYVFFTTLLLLVKSVLVIAWASSVFLKGPLSNATGTAQVVEKIYFLLMDMFSSNDIFFD